MTKAKQEIRRKTAEPLAEERRSDGASETPSPRGGEGYAVRSDEGMRIAAPVTSVTGSQ